MGKDYSSDVIAFVERLKPTTLLCVGPEGGLFADYVAAEPARRLRTAAPDTLLTEGPGERFDLAYLSATLERLPRLQGERLLARLRDLYSRQLLVLAALDGTSGWTENDLLGFGMVRMGRYADGAGLLALYRFDLATYKTTPDWFGPHHWANPDRWDRDWW